MSHDLDTTNSGRGVWLVKIPKYMRQKWAENPGNSAEVGKLKIQKIPGRLPQVTFSCGEQYLNDEEIPREHKFILHPIKEMTLGVFSHVPASGSGDGGGAEVEKLYMEGQVIQKFECQPVVDRYYMNQKKAAVIKAAQPNRKAGFIDRPVNSYRPTAKHAHTVELEERKKQEGKKARDDKERVMEMLFTAFEKHQYYNIKDLQKLTRQPITYLKEILKEVCDYNVKNPHKNTWELKPEYRHYKRDEAEAADDPGSD
ncbi:general transcription factor IIF subunit 2 [Macrobrachium rosenbergii]|uniref:general transcription factor IIF subunit 2 n=1 Tax=Macrobrachium rosenbergii TaxID=79674 RepID=UPI0034D60B35